MRIKNTDKLAVLLIDMQNNFLKDEQELLDLIPNQIEVLEFCNKNGIPVFVFEYIARKNFGDTNSLLQEKISTLGSTDVHWMKKFWDDAFTNKELDGMLQSYNVDHLFLMGVRAGFCVFDTARSAFDLGYNVLTSSNVIAGYDYADGEFNEQCPNPGWYKQNGVYVNNHQDILGF